MQIEAVNATFANLKIGYIRGVGDNVMPMLEELGLSVVELDPVTLPRTNLSGFTTIVVGSRAYEANPAAMVADTPLLMKFARDGGTIVTQYGHAEMAQPGMLPLPDHVDSHGRSRDRRERGRARARSGLAAARVARTRSSRATLRTGCRSARCTCRQTFDPQYRRVFSMNDKGDPPNDAAVLIAPVGKGTYVFTTFSFFRQLAGGQSGRRAAVHQSSVGRPAIGQLVRSCHRPRLLDRDARFAAVRLHRRRGDSHHVCPAPTWRW